MTKQEIAKSFIQMAGTGQVKEAFNLYIADDFIHHNQYFEGSREALEIAMTEDHIKAPISAIDIKKCYLVENENTVVTHSLVQKAKMDIAVVHIFRFSANKIVELWDLGQLIEKNSPNENGLF